MNDQSTVLDIHTAYTGWLHRRSVAKAKPEEREVAINTFHLRHRYCALFMGEHQDVKVCDLKPHHLCDLAEKWNNGKERAIKISVKACFSWAAKRGYISANPFAGVEVPEGNSRVDADETIIPTEEEHQLLLKTCDASTRMFLVGLNGIGCRPSELAAVTAAHFKGGDLVFKRRSTKTHKTKVRVIYLSEDMQKLMGLLASQYPTGPLFRTSKGNAWTKDRIKSQLAYYKGKAGIERKITCGSYRHRFATTWLRNKGNIEYLRILLGHRDYKMIMHHYSHLAGDAEAIHAEMRKVMG